MTRASRATGLDLLKKGRGQLRYARGLRSMPDLAGQAEAKARESLRTLRSAMNWLEGTEEFDDAHRALDEAGVWVRTEFDCLLSQSGNSYSQSCPVALAHNRGGLSIGMKVGRIECSICELEASDPNCPHIVGKEYDGERCIRVHRELVFDEVSLVARPRFPDARIESIAIEEGELRSRLPREWRPGVPVHCDFCLTACEGLARPFGGHPS